MAAGRGRPLHFIVEVQGSTPDNRPTHNILSHHASALSAFGAVVKVLQQWEASHGAIPVGTAVKIKDVRDGGTIWYMQYLGYEENTLLGR